VSEHEVWLSPGALRAKGLLNDKVAEAIREMAARAVINNMSVTYGVMGSTNAFQVEGQPTGPIIVAASAIGEEDGVVKVIFVMRGGVTGLTLYYELDEGLETPEGLRVRVSIGRGEGWFTVEGTVTVGGEQSAK
jgi:hypothetical protein